MGSANAKHAIQKGSLKPRSEFRGAALQQSYLETRLLHGVLCMQEQFCVFTKAVSSKRFEAVFERIPSVFCDFLGFRPEIVHFTLS